jgi:transposase-like protein
VYSQAFKLKVVQEYERGTYSLEELQKRYGIGGKCTISTWIKKMGRNELLGRKVLVMNEDEKTENQKLKEEIRQLQKVISHQKIEVLALESLFEVAGEEFGEDFKKNCLKKLPAEVRKKLEGL